MVTRTAQRRLRQTWPHRLRHTPVVGAALRIAAIPFWSTPPEIDAERILSAKALGFMPSPLGIMFQSEGLVLAVLKAAKARGAREWCMTLVAYKHGMRASEVCNLRLDDVKLRNCSIVVQRLKGSLRTVQAIAEHRGEPVLNEVKALREWLRERRDDGSDFLFASQKGGRIDRSQFFRLFRSIAAAANLPSEKGHPHAPKHSLASHLVAANINLALGKQQLGHKSIGSTMRYITTSDQQASKAAAGALMGIY